MTTPEPIDHATGHLRHGAGHAEPVVNVRADGFVDFGPDMTEDEASRRIWEGVQMLGIQTVARLARAEELLRESLDYRVGIAAFMRTKIEAFLSSLWFGPGSSAEDVVIVRAASGQNDDATFEPVAEEADAPDALVERLLAGRPVTRAEVADRIEAQAADLATLRSTLAAHSPQLAEAKRLLRQTKSFTTAGHLDSAIDAFLAGSATPPEAPQQTAPNPMEDRLVAVLPQGPVTFSQRDVGYLARQGDEFATADTCGEALDRLFGKRIALADAVAPTEADRP